jgi:hypothetical protein
MKRSILFIVLACFLAGPALAATSDTALQVLILGNQKHSLEQSLNAVPTAAVVVDPSVLLSPATLFGIAEPRLVAIAPSDPALADKVAVPLVIILGTKKEAVWDLYAKVIEQAPELVHALIKGQTSMLGAMVSPVDNSVEILGVHPELLVMAGRYILAESGAVQAVEDPTPKPVISEELVQQPAKGSAPVDKAQVEAEPAVTQEEVAPDTDVEAILEAIIPDQDKAEVAESSGGGLGFFGVLLFIAALVGTIVFMDKTVLRP